MSAIAELEPSVCAVRPFLPAKDFETSFSFYEALGFQAYRLGDAMAEMNLGPHAFLLQDFYVKEQAENTMMHVLVTDLDGWWRHIDGLALAERFGVRPPAAPHDEPWGLRVAYVFDPSGILWHFAEEMKPEPGAG